uniref:Uncharacterized protein n=1 Tax=Monopterus albus TaxID=43700 RepID=A0A3Q3Q3D9_MONAL
QSQHYLLSLKQTQGEGAPCSVVGPVGALHPVQGLLERFEAGPGCTAREHRDKETHVIAVGRATSSPGNKVVSSQHNSCTLIHR